MNHSMLSKLTYVAVLLSVVFLAGCGEDVSTKVNVVNGAVMSTAVEYESYDQSLADLQKGQPE